MVESQREAQKRASRDAILEAVAGYVVEHGDLAFSMAAIAQRAGVSPRTLYNHFATRQDMIEALNEWAAARAAERGEIQLPSDIASLPEAVHHNFLSFEQDAEINEAYARLDTVTAGLPGRERRTRAFDEQVARAYPDLDDRRRLAVTGALRTVASGRTWYVLTREIGLSPEEAAATGAWMMERMIDGLDAGVPPVFD